MWVGVFRRPKTIKEKGFGGGGGEELIGSVFFGSGSFANWRKRLYKVK